ncbi:MAG: Hpt domain-containing protein, partial [Dolichospermum sp.]
MIMQPEEQILGYFIEEAKEQLNTIEQGLLNLETTLKNAEMMNEIFRAAHSIKGSASMLGLSSIQHTSHCLEDWFKILQEHPVKVDINLESLLLDICDRLKILIDNLSFPIDLSEQESEVVISKWLDEHRKKLQSLISIYDHEHLYLEISDLNSFAGLFATDISSLDDNWPAEEILEDITNYQLLTTDNEIDDNDQDLSDLLLWEDKKISSKDVEFFDLIGSQKIEHLFNDVVETNRDGNFNLSLWEEENELATSPYLEITSSASETDSAITSSLTEASLLNELAPIEGILAATPREIVNQVVIE